ncbi:hypothetical protein [Bacillus sp. AFS073361]|uniref:hypothetical protein n=1 Tax=Bacillus sp. AFS073361 TaxID=2033511 RepID=UPI0015D4F999|nr:hypothetical protein [Bacillus sp. AFS073361]
MGRRSTKELRLDGMTQWQKRKFKKKNSPQGQKEKNWTQNLLERLKGTESG